MATVRLRPSSYRFVSVLLLALLVSASTATATTATSSEQFRSRKLLVTEPRVSPETTSLTGAQQQQQQEMDVGGWRAATPFRRPEASLGRRIPGSHANPSHN